MEDKLAKLDLDELDELVSDLPSTAFPANHLFN